MWQLNLRGNEALVNRLIVDVSPAERLLGVRAEERRFSPSRPKQYGDRLGAGRPPIRLQRHTGRQTTTLSSRAQQLEATPIAGTEDSDTPFFSPDGGWIGFWKANSLRKVPVDGGPVVTLCNAEEIQGASWGPNNIVVFAPRGEGIWHVSADGGAPQQLTKPDPARRGSTNRHPRLLPDGRALLFTTVGLGVAPRIVVRSLASGEETTLIEDGADARFVSGYLVFSRGGILMAAPFDPARLQLTGAATALVDNVMQAVGAPSNPLNTLAAQFDISSSGTLLYVPGGTFPAATRSLIWVDRSGKVEALNIPPKAYLGPRLSPDSRYVALFTQTNNPVEIVVYDLLRGSSTRIETGRSARNFQPGLQTAHVSLFSAIGGLFWQAADGSSPSELLLSNEQTPVPESWSRNTKTLAYYRGGNLGEGDIWVLEASESGWNTRPFRQSSAREYLPELSPDGRWIAYASDESGVYTMYAQPYPGPGKRQQVSIDGGTQPVWSRNGQRVVLHRCRYDGER